MNTSEACRQFADKTKWKKTGDGWMRESFNGYHVELVDCGNSFYQPIVDRDRVPSWYLDRRKCDNLADAIRYAWDATRAILETDKHPEITARMSMSFPPA